MQTCTPEWRTSFLSEAFTALSNCFNWYWCDRNAFIWNFLPHPSPKKKKTKKKKTKKKKNLPTYPKFGDWVGRGKHYFFNVALIFDGLNKLNEVWAATWQNQTSSPKGNDRSTESNVPRSICPKTLCSLSPTPMMLHIKFDQDWPTGFRDIQVQKCEIFVTQGQVTPKWVVWSGPK